MRNIIITIMFIFAFQTTALAQKSPKAKFYDFSEQVIDGEIKKPRVFITDTKKRVKFDRLLKLKKSFIPDLMKTSEEKTFK